MSRVSGSYTTSIVIFFAILIIILPVSAYNVTLYGTNSGFDTVLHNDSVVVLQSIPGSAGTDLDSNITRFIQPSADVIILGGEDTFSLSTAAKIEAAVAEGKILVVTYPCNRLFNASLPAYNNGTVPGGQFLEVSDPTAAASKEIFAGLPTRFSLQGAAPENGQVVTRNGSVTVLNYDTGMPALLYGTYGKGYVIEWTTRPVPSYMNGGTADTILDRLITRLLPVPAPIPTTLVTPQQTTVMTALPETSITTPPPVPSETPIPTTGNVTAYSSPPGASILIDGIYYGTTPANLTGIQQGTHIIRLTQSGYYDYEGSIYVIPGQTSHAFGTLPPLNQVQAAATPVSIIVPVVTAEPTQAKGLFENSSIVVAIIGVITAMIAAGATIFSHVMKAKKE
ncbi:MAG: PEGA domain-containing protein [Methanoregula sp.]